MSNVFDSSISQLPMDAFSLFLAFTAYNIKIKNVNVKATQKLPSFLVTNYKNSYLKKGRFTLCIKLLWQLKKQ